MSWLPEDKKKGCGWGPFKINDPVMDPGCDVHDPQYQDNQEGTHYQPRPGLPDDPPLTREESDRRLFANWDRKWRTTDGTFSKWLLIKGAEGIVRATSWLFWVVGTLFGTLLLRKKK